MFHIPTCTLNCVLAAVGDDAWVPPETVYSPTRVNTWLTLRAHARHIELRAMKTVVFILVLLAALKLGHQEYLYRAGTRDAIIAAYKDRAVQACQKDGRTASLGLTSQVWANSPSVQFVVGKSNLDVQLWQVDNQLWSARYRNPFLILVAGSRTGQIYCEYDIVNAAASVHRM
jgi:hypothetical protein